MLSDESSPGGFRASAEEKAVPEKAKNRLVLAPGEWAALSRFGCGEWIPEIQTDRLIALGLVEKVFGQALLTRLGRTKLGLEG